MGNRRRSGEHPRAALHLRVQRPPRKARAGANQCSGARAAIETLNRVFTPDEAATRALGARFVRSLRQGDVVFLHGELGAGKTTLVRGMLEELGVADVVKSPTYDLIQLFDTNPPVMHADLYRVRSHTGIGLEDYLETHLCLIEWPDRAIGLVETHETWRVAIEFEGEGRRISITRPT